MKKRFFSITMVAMILSASVALAMGVQGSEESEIPNKNTDVVAYEEPVELVVTDEMWAYFPFD